MTYTVIYEKGAISWGAYVPDLPGVITIGDTREEVEELIREAVEFHRRRGGSSRCLVPRIDLASSQRRSVTLYQQD